MEKEYSFIESENQLAGIWADKQRMQLINKGAGDIFSILQIANCADGWTSSIILTDIIARRKIMQGFRVRWCTAIDLGKGAKGTIKNRLSRQAKKLGLVTHKLSWVYLPGTSRGNIAQLRATAIKVFHQLLTGGLVYRENTSGPWLLRTSLLVDDVVEAMEKGYVRFFPNNWKKVFFNWMQNVHDRRISCLPPPHSPPDERLFPVIPVFYCPACKRYGVRAQRRGPCTNCGSSDITWGQEVFDNRFLEIFPPFSGISQPVASSPRRNGFYPTALMVSSARGLVSRVVGITALGARGGLGIPLRDVLLTGKVVEKEKRRKRLQYGIDALRLAMALHVLPAQDISISAGQMKGAHAFLKKLWNAARYVCLHVAGDEPQLAPGMDIPPAGKWILDCLSRVIEKSNRLMEEYQIMEASRLLYRFTRYDFCSRYIELSREDIANPVTRAVLGFVLVNLLQLLHPFIPFITETIFRKMKYKQKDTLLLHTAYPSFNAELIFKTEYAQFEVLKKLVAETRKVRAVNGISPTRKIRVFLKTESKKERNDFMEQVKYFDVLAGSSETIVLEVFTGLPKGFRGSCTNWEILLPFADEEERLLELNRLKMEYFKLEEEIQRMNGKLSAKNYSGRGTAAAATLLKRELRRVQNRKDKLAKTIADIT